MMLMEIVFCFKEFFKSAAFARPHSFLDLVSVLVMWGLEPRLWCCMWGGWQGSTPSTADGLTSLEDLEIKRAELSNLIAKPNTS